MNNFPYTENDLLANIKLITQTKNTDEYKVAEEYLSNLKKHSKSILLLKNCLELSFNEPAESLQILILLKNGLENKKILYEIELESIMDLQSVLMKYLTSFQMPQNNYRVLGNVLAKICQNWQQDTNVLKNLVEQVVCNFHDPENTLIIGITLFIEMISELNNANYYKYRNFIRRVYIDFKETEIVKIMDQVYRHIMDIFTKLKTNQSQKQDQLHSELLKLLNMLLEFDQLGQWDETQDPSNMIMYPNSFKEFFFGIPSIDSDPESGPENRFKLANQLYNMADIYLANIYAPTESLYPNLFLCIKNLTAICMCRKSMVDDQIRKPWYTFLQTRLQNQLENLQLIDWKQIKNADKEQFNSLLSHQLTFNGKLQATLGNSDMQKILDVKDILNLNKKLQAFVNHLISQDNLVNFSLQDDGMRLLDKILTDLRFSYSNSDSCKQLFKSFFEFSCEALNNFIITTFTRFKSNDQDAAKLTGDHTTHNDCELSTIQTYTSNLIKCNSEYDMQFVMNHWLDTLLEEMTYLLQTTNYTTSPEQKLIDRKIAFIMGIVSQSISFSVQNVSIESKKKNMNILCAKALTLQFKEMIANNINSVEYLIEQIKREDIKTFPHAELAFMKFIKVFRKEFLKDYLEQVFEQDSQTDSQEWMSYGKVDKGEQGIVKYILADLGLPNIKRLVDYMIIKSVLVINKSFSNTNVLEFYLNCFEEIVSGQINSMGSSDREKTNNQQSIEIEILTALTNINISKDQDQEKFEQETFCQNVSDFQKVFLNTPENAFIKVFNQNDGSRYTSLKRDKLEHKIWKAQGNIYLLEDQELQIIDLYQKQQNLLTKLSLQTSWDTNDAISLRKIVLCNVGLIDASSQVGQFMRIIDFNEKMISILRPLVFNNKCFFSDPNLIISILKLIRAFLVDRDRRFKFDNVSNQAMIIFETVQTVLLDVHNTVLVNINLESDLLTSKNVQVIVKLLLQIYSFSLQLDFFHVGTMKWQGEARVDHFLVLLMDQLRILPVQIYSNIDKYQLLVIGLYETFFTKQYESWLQINDKMFQETSFINFDLPSILNNFFLILKETIAGSNTTYMNSLCNSIDKITNLTYDIQRRHRRMEGYLTYLRQKHQVLQNERNIDSIQRSYERLNIESNPGIKQFWDNLLETLLQLVVSFEISNDNLYNSFYQSICINFKHFDDIMKQYISSKKLVNQNKITYSYNKLILQEVKFNIEASQRDKFTKNFKLFIKELVEHDSEDKNNLNLNSQFNGGNNNGNGKFMFEMM